MALHRVLTAAEKAKAGPRHVEELIKHPAIAIGSDEMDESLDPVYDEETEYYLPNEGGNEVIRARDEARLAAKEAEEIVGKARAALRATPTPPVTSKAAPYGDPEIYQ